MQAYQLISTTSKGEIMCGWKVWVCVLVIHQEKNWTKSSVYLFFAHWYFCFYKQWSQKGWKTYSKQTWISFGSRSVQFCDESTFIFTMFWCESGVVPLLATFLFFSHVFFAFLLVFLDTIKSMVGWSSLQFKLTLKDNAIIESPWGNCTKTLLSLLKFF